MKKIRVFGLILAVMALVAFLASCSNPAGPRGDRPPQTQNPVIRGGITIDFCDYWDPVVTDRPDEVTYDIVSTPPAPGYAWVIIFRPADRIAKDEINVLIPNCNFNVYITRGIDADGDYYMVVIWETIDVVNNVYIGHEYDAWGNPIYRNGDRIVTVLRAPAGVTATVTDPWGDEIITSFGGNDPWVPLMPPPQVWRITLYPANLIDEIINKLPPRYLKHPSSGYQNGSYIFHFLRQ